MEVISGLTPAGVGEIGLHGELDMETAPRLTRMVREVLKSDDVHTVEVDMSAVTFCDSSGIAALDEAYHRATQQDVRFRVTGIQAPVRRVLQIVGLLETLTRP